MLHQIGASADTRAPTSIMNPRNDALVPQLAIRDKNTLPIKNVATIMRKVLPPNTKISRGAKEMVEQITSMFIRYVTKKAIERCHRECRKILGPDDLLRVMESIGYNNYYEYLNFYLKCFRYSNEIGYLKLVGELPKPTLPAFQIASPTLPPPPPIAIGSDLSLNSNSFIDLDEAVGMNEVWNELDNFGVGSPETALTNFDHSIQFNFDDIFQEMDDKMND